MPHSDNNGYHHFVWATWDREPLLTPEIEQHAYALIRQQCQLMKVKLVAIGGIADHVHLLVTTPLTLSFSDFMESVKGASARALNHTYGSATWAFKWQDGYHYSSVSATHVPGVTHYIANQKQHHAAGNLWLSCEPQPRKQPESKRDI